VGAPAAAAAPPAEDSSMKDIVKQATAELEKDLILKALAETQGNVTQAAKKLKISRKSLQNKMKEFGLRDGERDAE
jgi:DNA-binding NtrC family response regulator